MDYQRPSVRPSTCGRLQRRHLHSRRDGELHFDATYPLRVRHDTSSDADVPVGSPRCIVREFRPWVQVVSVRFDRRHLLCRKMFEEGVLL